MIIYPPLIEADTAKSCHTSAELFLGLFRIKIRTFLAYSVAPAYVRRRWIAVMPILTPAMHRSIIICPPFVEACSAKEFHSGTELFFSLYRT
jgi:hypothetical protein